MEGGVFEYDPNLLQECALSDPSSFLHSTDPGLPCIQLFQEFSNHYHEDKSLPLEWDRLEPFFQNVVMVYNHNKDENMFTVTLNHFSDRFPQELPFAEMPLDWKTMLTDSTKQQQQQQKQKQQNNNRRRLQNEQPVYLAEIFPNVSYIQYINYAPVGVVDGVSEPPIGFVPSIRGETWEPLYGNTFDESLNWATTQNPDGVAIVRPPPFQGSCGSCWAWTGTALVEASAARRAAHQTFLEQQQQQSGNYEDAVRAARDKEQESLVSLSVQELLDCDTRYNHGCVGGNPIFSYFFVRAHGLTTASAYPYLGYQGAFCRTNLVHEAVATVANWAIVEHDQEDMMLQVVKHVGPIGIALHATSPSFLHYRGGIYDNPDCANEKANHAMVVVGYGEEIVTTNANNQTKTERVKYWLARNSWGIFWGENGYVKFRRGTSGPGVCGLAVSANVAIGATLLPKPTLLNESTLPPAPLLLHRVSSPSPTTASPTTASPTTASPTCGSSCQGWMNFLEQQLPLIVGLSVAAVAVLVLALVVLIKMRRQKQKQVVFVREVPRSSLDPVPSTIVITRKQRERDPLVRPPQYYYGSP